MIKYEVEKGHLLDVKLKEGHIWYSGELFDELEEAEKRFNRVVLDMTQSNEYVCITRQEFDGDDLLQCDVIQTSYMIDRLEALFNDEEWD